MGPKLFTYVQVFALLFLVISLAANAFQWWERKRETSRLQSKIRDAEAEAAKLKTEPQPTTDAKQILHDLTRGEALVRIRRVDPEDVVLRSPRDRR